MIVFTGLIILPFFTNAAANEFGKPLRSLVEKEVDGIHFFEGTWKEALDSSARTGKLIFLDAYASWCGPCKIMSKKVFTNTEVGNYFNAHFINYKMDMEKHEEGARLTRQFMLEAYPSLYFINANEEIIKQAIGYHGSEDFIKLGEKALKANVKAEKGK